jgi:hypothetical protein
MYARGLKLILKNLSCNEILLKLGNIMITLYKNRLFIKLDLKFINTIR